MYASHSREWTDSLLPADVPYEEWLERVTDHVVGGITSRLSYRGRTEAVDDAAAEG